MSRHSVRASTHIHGSAIARCALRHHGGGSKRMIEDACCRIWNPDQQGDVGPPIRISGAVSDLVAQCEASIAGVARRHQPYESVRLVGIEHPRKDPVMSRADVGAARRLLPDRP